MKPKKETLLEIARNLVGTPYLYGAEPKENPKNVDCSGFIQLIYKLIGFKLERSTIRQAAFNGKEVPLTQSPKKTLEVGDLLFFRGRQGHYKDDYFPDRKIYIGHMVIYSGDNKVIHACSRYGVIEEGLENIIKSHGPVVMIKRII